MLSVVMAVSADGYVARHRDRYDDMSWSGRQDKAVFRAMTLSAGGILAAGRRTFEHLPYLPGRQVVCISRSAGMDLPALMNFARGRHVWLIGGQEVVLNTLARRMVDEVNLCRSTVKIRPPKGDGLVDGITPTLQAFGWSMAAVTGFRYLTVETWRP